MPSSRAAGLAAVAALATLLVSPRAADAQVQAKGFAVERLYQSAPGAGWFVMDDLAMHGPLGGGIALTTGYAHDPLVLTDGTQRLRVVSDQAFFDLGVAVTLYRFRFYTNVTSPLSVSGESGIIGGTQFNGVAAGVAPNPDTFGDVRFGVDARLYGEHDGPFRLGLGAQLFVDAGDRADFITDGSYRAMFRALAAGDRGPFSYAAQVGAHVRPLDDAASAGSPRGTELLYGVAGGWRFPLVARRVEGVLGPEFFGETAFAAFAEQRTSNLEGLLSGRVEGGPESGMRWRAKLGIGAGLVQHFGAPDFRMVFGIELFGHPDKDASSH